MLKENRPGRNSRKRQHSQRGPASDPCVSSNLRTDDHDTIGACLTVTDLFNTALDDAKYLNEVKQINDAKQLELTRDYDSKRAKLHDSDCSDVNYHNHTESNITSETDTPSRSKLPKKMAALDYLISKSLMDAVERPYMVCNNRLSGVLHPGENVIGVNDIIEIMIEKSFNVR